MFLTKEQRASQGIDTSFGPNAIAGIYLAIAGIYPELYPLKPALYTTQSELNLAFLTMTQVDLVDAE